MTRADGHRPRPEDLARQHLRRGGDDRRVLHQRQHRAQARALLTTLLVNHDRAKELRDTYKSSWSRDLDATLAYGDLRPIDKLYIAMVQAGTDEALLFEGLGRCNANTIEADFKSYEFRGLAFDDNASSKREPGVAAELGIPGLIARVAQASQDSAAGAVDTKLGANIANLHGEANAPLKALVDRKGAEYVAGMFH
jgi:hypothetical protein